MTDPTNATAPMSPPAPRPDSGGGEPTDWEATLHRLARTVREALPPIGEAFTALRDSLPDSAGPRDRKLIREWMGPDPAPSGLTAAQEIRLALTLKAMELAEKATAGDIKADDEDIADFVHIVAGLVTPLAALIEHGGDVRTDPDARTIPDTAACPDPSLHEELRGYELRRVAELMTELLETHADLEASRAREQIAQQDRHDLIVERDALAAQCIDAPARVILLERQVAELERERDEPSQADVLFADGGHIYWSTHCRHGNHDACNATEFAPGVQRQPSQCKTCAAPCRCECHKEPDHA